MVYMAPPTAIPEANVTLVPEAKVAIAQDYDGMNYTFENVTYFFLTNEMDPSCADPHFGPNDTISAPHSNSFIDLDGDCMPDIFM